MYAAFIRPPIVVGQPHYGTEYVLRDCRSLPGFQTDTRFVLLLLVAESVKFRLYSSHTTFRSHSKCVIHSTH